MRARATFDGDTIFIWYDGIKIAKRGLPDTPHAGTWISLEPGWRVLDVGQERKAIIIEHDETMVH
jgi:hypothetical protein